MYLMCEDVKVMHFDTANGVYDVLVPDLLPYQLRGALVQVDMSSLQSALRTAGVNRNVMVDYFSQRVLALGRANAKKLLNLLGYAQMQDSATRAQVALSCRAVSIADNYWVLGDKESRGWDSVNVRHVSLNEVVAQVALHGTSLTLRSRDVTTPELTTQGAYAKCWKRMGGDLWLYKAGDRDSDYESHVEVCVSRLLDKTNLRHVTYEDAISRGRYCCRCKCMSSDSISLLSGVDFCSYCTRLGLNPMAEAHRIDGEMMYGMHIFDYLVSNVDRHGGNWGFLYDSRTMRILGCHPLFDHNNAFDRQDMESKDGGSCKFFSGRTMQETAKYSMSRCGFRFTERVSRLDFMDSVQYRSFMNRAERLGIRIRG